VLPDVAALDEGLWIPTFEPRTLETSEVIVTALQTMAGSGPFASAEPGPVDAPLASGARICCESAFVDTLESRVSLPSVCLDAIGFGTMKPAGDASHHELLGPAAVDTAGALVLMHCLTADLDGRPADIGRDRPQFVFAFHGQAVGPYGIVASGKYAP